MPGRIVLIENAFKNSFLVIIQMETERCADIELMIRSYFKGSNVIRNQFGAILPVCVKSCNRATVIPVQSFVGSQPHEPFLILSDGENAIVLKSVIRGN